MNLGMYFFFPIPTKTKERWECYECDRESKIDGAVYCAFCGKELHRSDDFPDGYNEQVYAVLDVIEDCGMEGFAKHVSEKGFYVGFYDLIETVPRKAGKFCQIEINQTDAMNKINDKYFPLQKALAENNIEFSIIYGIV